MVLLLYSAIALISSYAFVGGAIKYLDQIVDQHPKSPQKFWTTWVLTICLIVITTLLVFFDYFTAILAIALLLGLLITQKIDNRYFAAIAIPILLIGIWVFLQFALPLILASFTPLFLSVIIDEIFHEFAPRISSSLFHWIFAHRPVLKIMVIVLPVFGLLTFFHSIAFWSFDIAYDGVAYYVRAPNSAATSSVAA